jgi:hypothetical protein
MESSFFNTNLISRLSTAAFRPHSSILEENNETTSDGWTIRSKRKSDLGLLKKIESGPQDNRTRSITYSAITCDSIAEDDSDDLYSYQNLCHNPLKTQLSDAPLRDARVQTNSKQSSRNMLTDSSSPDAVIYPLDTFSDILYDTAHYTRREARYGDTESSTSGAIIYPSETIDSFESNGVDLLYNGANSAPSTKNITISSYDDEEVSHSDKSFPCFSEYSQEDCPALLRVNAATADSLRTPRIDEQEVIQSTVRFRDPDCGGKDDGSSEKQLTDQATQCDPNDEALEQSKGQSDHHRAIITYDAHTANPCDESSNDDISTVTFHARPHHKHNYDSNNPRYRNRNQYRCRYPGIFNPPCYPHPPAVAAWIHPAHTAEVPSRRPWNPSVRPLDGWEKQVDSLVLVNGRSPFVRARLQPVDLGLRRGRLNRAEADSNSWLSMAESNRLEHARNEPR